MTVRSIYRFLLRLHPACFRKQYEDQMLWIFDESVRSRGAVSLLIDATVSLVRQWVLRSGYWRNAQPAMAAGGTTALAEALRQNSQKLFRRSRWLNFIWLAGALIVLVLCPGSTIVNFEAAFWILFTLNAFSPRKKPNYRWSEGLQYYSLFRYEHLRNVYRTKIEEQRDGLRAWAGKAERISDAGRIVATFAILSVLKLVVPFVRSYLGKPTAGLDWIQAKYFFCSLILLTLSWLFMNRFNERAAQAFQQEIDAIDASSKPQSV